MAYKAYVFARPGGAIIFGESYGHEAFGFQTDDANTTLVGGVELADGKTSHVNDAMDFWTRLTDNPLNFMSTQVPYKRRTRYDMAKILQVDNPNVVASLHQSAGKRDGGVALRSDYLTQPWVTQAVVAV